MNFLKAPACALLLGIAITAGAQTPPQSDPDTPALRALLASQQAIENDFIDRLKQNGFEPTLPPPTIVISTTPRLSAYVPGNFILIPQWDAAPPPMQQAFLHWGEVAGYGSDGRTFFDAAFHKFFAVHEVAHWVERQGNTLSQPTLPYPLNRFAHELEANRLALAYWRQRDPAYAEQTVAAYRKAYAAMPNPVPPGEDVAKYFTEHYAALGPTPAYGWFQMRLVLEAADESPAPTLRSLVKEAPQLTYR